MGMLDRFRKDKAAQPLVAAKSETSMSDGGDGGNDGWIAEIAGTLDRIYGHSGVGFARDEPDAVARYVSLHPAADHIVYATFGSFRQRFPHEFVLRLRFDAPRRGEELWEAAPMWPVEALAEIARVEARMERPFAPGNHLSNMEVGGEVLKYHHFAFVTDPVLPRISLEGAKQPLVFVQVVPLTDVQEAAIAGIPAGATNTVLADWAERDDLLLVEDP